MVRRAADGERWRHTRGGVRCQLVQVPGFWYDIEQMDNIVHDAGSAGPAERPVLVYQPVIEQAMAWLLAHGPLVVEPPVPDWALRRLVAGDRIMRLQRGLYLVPRPDATLPSFDWVVANVLDDGYVSFQAALFSHGLSDRQARRWVALVPTRRRPVRYGELELFFLAPTRDAAAATTVRRAAEGAAYHLATPHQAMLDCLRWPRYAPSVVELAQALRTGLLIEKIHQSTLETELLDSGSVALARRGGALLGLAGAEPRNALRRLAQKTHDYTDLQGTVPDRVWRVRLPDRAERLAAQVDL